MRVILIDYAHRQLNNLYSNWRFFKNDKEFSEAFKYYSNCLLRDFDRFSSGGLPFTIHGRYRRVILPSVQIFYRVTVDGRVVISSFLFVGLGRVQKLSALEKRNYNRGTAPTRRPSNVLSSLNPADYTPSNLDGGTIRGMIVQVVKRKNMTTPSGKAVYNYLYKGRILSAYDFLNTTPFTDYDGVERAYAHGANGVEYWVFPTRRMPQPRRMYESIQRRIEQIITETINSYFNRECRLVG